MAVDVSKIPNNNKFDPVRKAILQLQEDIQAEGQIAYDGQITVGKVTGSTITVTGGSFSVNQANPTTISIGIDDSGYYSTSGGEIDGDVDITGNLVVEGNLTVSGATITKLSEEVLIEDNIIVLNSNETGTPSLNAGIEIERGTSPNVDFLWNETSNEWDLRTYSGARIYRYGVGSTTLTIEAGSTAGDAVIALTPNTTGTGGVIKTTNEKDIAFQPNSTTKMVIASGGDVNIYDSLAVGKTGAPSYELDVDGDGYFTGDVTATTFIKDGGTASQFLKADGSVDSNTYLTTESDTLQSVTTRGASTTRTIHFTGGAGLNVFNIGNTTRRLTINQSSGDFPRIYNFNESNSTFHDIIIGGGNNDDTGLKIGAGNNPDTTIFGTLHVGSSANLEDGTNPQISTVTAYATTKVVTPKLVFLNDATGDDNYITHTDNNAAYTVNGQQMGAWYEFVGDKLAANTNNSAGIVASGLLTKQIQSTAITTSSVTGATLNLNATTKLNLQYDGDTKAYVDASGFNVVGGLNFGGVDGISLTDEDSTIDSFFHANVNYDAGLYQVTSNARYGADYIQVDGNDSRTNTAFTIAPKELSTLNPRLYLGGNNSITAPNTLIDWQQIVLNAENVIQNVTSSSINGALFVSGNATADSFIKDGGTASQFLKADGSVDSNTYLASFDITTQTDPKYLRSDANDTTSGELNIDSGVLRVRSQATNISKIALAESVLEEHVILEYDGTGVGATNYFHIYSGVSSWAAKGSSLNIQPSTGRVAIGNTAFLEVFHVTGNVLAALYKTGVGTVGNYFDSLQLRTAAGGNIELGGDGPGNVQNDVFVANGDLLIPNGSVGIGLTTDPTARLQVYGVGAANNPTIAIDNTSSATFNHSLEAFAGSMTAGQNNILLVGKEGNTKNAGYIGFHWVSAGSNDNYVSLGQWGVDNVFRIYGDKRAYFEGSVGIGTTSPNAKLEVNGYTAVGVYGAPHYSQSGMAYQVIKATGGSDSQRAMLEVHSGAGGTKAIFQAVGVNNTAYLTTLTNSGLVIGNNAVTMAFNTAGNVGIGTGSPSNPLHVYNAGNTRIRIDSGSNNAGIMLSESGSNKWSIASVSGGNLQFFSEAGLGNLMWLSSTGNLGIGTTSPSRKLHVAGDVYVEDSQTTGMGIVLRNGDRPLITRGWDAFTSGNKAGIGRWGVFMEAATLFLASPGTDYSNGKVEIGGFLADGTQQSTLTANNNTRRVGIGTTTPSQKLHVEDTRGEWASSFHNIQDENVSVYLSHGSGYGMAIDSTENNAQYIFKAMAGGASKSKGSYPVIYALHNGNVGIGTNSPNYKLDVRSSTVAGSFTAGDGGYTAVRFDGDAGATIGSLTTNAGKILIGSENVQGTGSNGEIQIEPSSGGAAIYINSSKNVGIGTTSPNGKFTTVGTYATVTHSLAANSAISISSIGVNPSNVNAFTIGQANSQNNSAVMRFKYNGAGSTSNYAGFGFYANDDILNIRADRNVGIGTTTPVSKLDVNGDTVTRGALYVVTGMETAGNFSACQIKLDATNTVDSTGWQGISFDTSTSANYGWSIGANRSNSGRGSFRFYEHNNSNAGVERFTIQQDGNVGIGDSTPSYKLDVNGNARISTNLGINQAPEGTVGLAITGNGSGQLAFRVYGGGFASAGEIRIPSNASGVIITNNGSSGQTGISFNFGAGAGSNVGRIAINSTSTSYVTTSDYRLKENLTEITNGIDRLKKLKPKRFNFIGHEQVVDGFVAHEAQEVVPESVTGVKDGVDYNGEPEYQGIDQAKLVPLLTAALQEAIAKIESLEQRILTLENK